jgi:uncharacterized protein YfaS (alpha-2-macroglobulin family)
MLPLGSVGHTMNQLIAKAWATTVWFLRKFIFPTLLALFGELRWSPPDWLRRSAQVLRRATGKLSTRLTAARQSSPRRFWISASTLLALIIVGSATLYWYSHLPEPYYLKVSVILPQPTPLRPEAQPYPLRLNFSGSAARLGAIGKKIESGITVTPSLEGQWSWNGDSELVFVPKDDWEVGREYTIQLSRSLFPRYVLLRNYSYTFVSPRFSLAVESAEFYEDPTDPKVKKVVAEVHFTHPVDKADFEKRISFRMRVEPVKNFSSAEAKSYGFKVIYDKTGGVAYIHSDPFPIPDKPGEMMLEIEKGTRSARGGPGASQRLERTVLIPGVEDYFRIDRMTASEVPNQHDEIERIGTVYATAAMRQTDLIKYVSVVLLPRDKPSIGDQPLQRNFRWTDPLEATPEVMAMATPVRVDWIAPEREYSNTQSFRFTADAGRALLVKIHGGLKSFGDYPLVKDFAAVIVADPFPKTIKIVSEGSLLSLSGEKKISILTRNVDAIEIEISRVLPGSVSHLVSQNAGTFSEPQFASYYQGGSFGLDDLSEVFSEVRYLNPDPTGKNRYTVFDFAPMLSNGALPRGLFSIKVQEWIDGQGQQAIFGGGAETSRFHRHRSQYSGVAGEQSDQRLIVLTDLGLLVKDSVDGTHDVFVQSIRTGAPVVGARVEILGRNGLPILTQVTNADGRVTFPDLKDFKRDKAPTVYVAEQDQDFSFIPYDRPDRRLNLSRFDTGGLHTAEISESLQAYLFSDRGIYRPGDQIHVGMIVKANGWIPLPPGLPLQLVVTDPRGTEIRREVIKFSPVGFEDFSMATQDDSPTGSYNFSLYVIRDRIGSSLLGSTTVRVEDFQPDRMTMRAELSAPLSAGWIAPDALSANVLLRNLFGTPAAGRRVKASFRLTPAGASFAKFAGYSFVDPYKTQKSYDEDLGDGSTDAEGRVKFDLKLERFEKGLFYLRFIAEGFEPEGGRSVVADASAIVSPLPYLVAFKPDGDLGYLKQQTVRSVHLIAVDPKLNLTAVHGLTGELIEFRYVSILTTQENGTLAYQSVRKEITKGKKVLDIPSRGLTLDLPTDRAGSFAIVIRNSQGDELNRISFEVIGQANVTRSLEREAELKIKLDKPDYKPGEEAEVEIQAPYVGAGLITIERDRIYQAKWFVTTTTESVQKIRIPDDLEGNGYVTVTFIRAMDSKEVFTSPLSYGSVPFSVSRQMRTQRLTLQVPKLIRPGDTLKIGYQTDGPARVALIAVDEGILQVARYRTPDPLSFFFQKRALEVTTSQILDLILPELHLLNESSAPGGDEEGLRARHQNPFKRKGQKPVAFWSGLIDSDGKPGSVAVPIPDYFNGTIRIIAVAVSERAIGVAESKTVSQGYFVIQPQAPYFASPGDEFEVTALIANNLQGATNGASAVTVRLDTADSLEVIGNKEQQVSITPGSDSTLRFRVRAKPSPGAASMTIAASGQGKRATLSLDMSVRPASPFVTTIESGYVKKGLLTSVKADLTVQRRMYPQYRDVEVSASAMPLGLSYGMIRYLVDYPYGCTEQIVSGAFPGVVLGSRPELGLSKERVSRSLARAMATLQGRQNSDGSFGLWTSGADTVPFINAYATHFLLEAREHGLEGPPSLLERALGSMRSATASPQSGLEQMRAQAYGLYLLARSGVVVTNQLVTLREALDRDYPKTWINDIAVDYMAGTYKLLRMDSEAAQLMRYARAARPGPENNSGYCDDLVDRAVYLYIASKHFPEIAKKISADDVLALADPIIQGRQNTFSSAYAILALEAYANAAASPQRAAIKFTEKLTDGSSRPLESQGDLFARANVPANAASVHVEGDTPFVLFYQLLEAGFDLEPPKEEIKDKIEVFREFRNEHGESIDSTSLESKVNVAVSVRAIDQEASNVAVVDLLPGGFELDLSREGIANRTSQVQGPATWHPDYIDVREDRVIFYGTIGTQAQTFVYRLKPTNRGKFTVAPLYAEGMYDRSIRARSLGGAFQVGESAAGAP